MVLPNYWNIKLVKNCKVILVTVSGNNNFCICSTKVENASERSFFFKSKFNGHMPRQIFYSVYDWLSGSNVFSQAY